MNARPLLALVLLATAAACIAQTPAPVPTDSAMARTVSTAPAPRSADERPSSQDPRACLEFATNEQIIACAERFRPRRASSKA